MQALWLKKTALSIGLTLLMTSIFSLVPQPALGQAISTNGGSIQGSITDATGGVIPGAKITVTNLGTSASRTLVTDSAGFYSIGPLIPGTYTVSVAAPGFKRTVVTTVVKTGTVTSGNIKLAVGSQGVTVEVNAGSIQVDTEQPGVAGVVTGEQIDSLPINGRNILDVAQLQPGVVLQSGQQFDPTKTGYSAIGMNGQNGRATRILIDGQDISDETVGTTVYNVPEGAIGEFQLNRANQDVSGEVTSTGQVLMSTRSGTNRIHGNVFGIFQDARAGFAGSNGLAGDQSPFQRNQFGGYAGGPILRDKLFFFGGAERVKQFDSSPVTKSNPNFGTLYSMFPNVPDPFKDTFSIGRLDYDGPLGVHYFVRATYSNNAAFGTAGQNPYALFQNQDNVPAIVGGADFTTGRFTHSLRFGYLKFINNINPGASSVGNSVYNPAGILGIDFELISSIYAGANYLAPQKTYQSSKQFRYDGTWTRGRHSIKYGGEVSRILEGGFAAFYADFLTSIHTTSTFQLAKCASSNPIGGVDGNGQCLGDPLYGYSPYEFVLGNGNGSFSERPGFGLPGGGQFSWRMAAYIGDTWKVRPYFTVQAGVRWSVDTDRANQDLPTPTCGQVDPSLQFSGCDSQNASTPLFNFFGPGLGLGKPTHQPWANFGPQLGFVFSPGSHKMAIRGGAGIFYENNLFNNSGNARAQNTPVEFPGWAYGLNHYYQSTLNLPGYANGIQGLTNDGDPCDAGSSNCHSWAEIYGMSVADASTLVAKLDTKYKAASAVPQPNTSFVGGGDALGVFSGYGGPYLTPYSIQLNGGVQYEFKPGIMLSVDYIHNATLKVPLTVDTNHVGSASFLEMNAAQNAIDATLSSCGAATIDAAIQPGGCPGGSGVDSSGAPNNSATIDDFANNGLDSGDAYLGGVAASAYGLTPDEGAAFAGANPNVGDGQFILPVGKSAYDALQFVFQEQKANPMRGILQSSAQISYNLSRAVTNSRGGSNQFFGGYGAWNNDHVNRYIGRNDLDYTNGLGLAGSVSLKYGPQIAVVGHFFSAPPSDLTLADVVANAQIFKTDLDGDGSTGDLLPGTNPGAYMHEVKGRGLNKLISKYNSTQAGTITPAGQALVDAGLFTQSQLVTMGAVKQALAPAPDNPLQNPATRTLDVRVAYPIRYLGRFREGLTITPTVSVYNVANMANYSGFGGLADANTDTSSDVFLNSPNTQENLNHNRTLRGSGNGTFDQGGPRTMEFQLKVEF
ncbi:MAG: carboxypeptidase regulatory-like domain-containing protein [Acidobacteriota bacterium]|nr:carboxypeptidase regulatory-like domain-containing protein [Acidobacteriota bacterium]